MSSRLLSLPEELLIDILCYFPFYSLISYRTICRTFNSVIADSKRLQYIIALETHHLVNNPNCSIHLSERLQLLEKREFSWRWFQINFTKRLDISHASWVHGLNGGVFLLGDSVNGHNVIASNRSHKWGTKAINCLILPSVGYSRLPRHPIWTNFDHKMDILNAGMAIQEHDLIAFVTTRLDEPSRSTLSTIEIQLVQFSTGRPHPSATLKSLLVTHTKQEAGRPEICLDILGCHLAILVTYETWIPDVFDQFFVFDWKKGTMIATYQLPHRTSHSLVFLNPQTLLLANIAHGALDMFLIPPSDEGHQTLIRVCSLALPRLRDPLVFRTICCHAQPNRAFPFQPDNQNHSLTEATLVLPHNERPFHPSPDHSIILFRIGLQKTTNAGDYVTSVYALVIHRQSLLSQILTQHMSTPSSLTSMASTVPWGEWGERCSHWFDDDATQPRLITAISGERYVRLASDHRIHVLDFNPHHVRWQLARGKEVDVPLWQRGGSVEVVHGRTKLMKSKPWKTKLQSELPYVLTVSEPKPQYHAVVMDEERIIGLEVCSLNLHIF